MKEQEPTNRELQVSINTLADTVNTVLETVNTFAESVDERFGKIEQEIGSIKATMVTKDYLDDKLAIRKADLILIDRKQEEKVDALVSKLTEKKVLTRQEADAIKRISPFPVRPTV